MDLGNRDGNGLASAQVAANPAATDAEPVAPPPAVAPNSEQPGTILSIQILRFIAALSVVLFHAHNALTDHLAAHKEDAIDHAFRVGASGVHIFFVISGFVMVYTTWRSRLTPGKFLSRRLIRIYPIYWVMAVTYFIVHLALGTRYHLGGLQFLGAALLFPETSSLIIGPGWTLSFEMYFYLCFALALLAGLKRGLVGLTAFYLLSTVAGRILAPHSAIGTTATNSLLLEFASGAWLGYVFAHGFAVRPRAGAALIFAGVVLFVSGFWLPYERLPSVISWGIPSLLLVTGALAFEPWLRNATGRGLAKLGDSSYLLYLSHILVIDLLIATPISVWNRSVPSAVWLTIPITAICTIGAALGYEAVERPLLKLLKTRLLPRRESRARPSATLA